MKVQGLEAHSLLFVSLLFGRCACAFFFFFSLPPPSAESGGSPGGRGDIAAVEKKRVGVGALLNPLNPRRARRRKLTREIYCAATDHVEALQFFFHTAIPTLRIAKLFFLSESSFRIVLSSRKISLRKFQLAFSMRDFPCWKDRIFQAGFCLFVQKFRVIEMIPRGNISGKTRNVVDRDFQCRSPSRAQVSEPSHEKKKAKAKRGKPPG